MANEYPTFQELLNRMLERIEKPVDKREGSFVFDMQAPAAFELAVAYYVWAYLVQNFYPDTAEGEWLDRISEKFGISRNKATKAIRKASFTGIDGHPLNVDIGSRWAIEDLTFTVLEKIEDGVFRLECEQAGEQGNNYSGTLLPVTYIAHLGIAELDYAPLIRGFDTEGDESLRLRLLKHLREKPFGGNISQYEQQALAFEGVGAVKVFSIWKGPGTVKLMIGDENKKIATKELVGKVQEYFQPLGEEEKGEGLAPVGHTVTVDTPTPLTINITAQVKVASGMAFNQVKEKIQDVAKAFIDEADFKQPILYQSRLAANISYADGVIDVRNVTLNGADSNLVLSKTATLYQMPVLGTVTVTEVK